MNEFLQQFLIESRELAEAASGGLTALEQSPGDTERLDAVFRAVHTLKGGAGIVDFTAMERAMDGIEDVLADARSGTRPLTAASIGRCTACLDQVSEWLEIIERTGELPGESAGQADRMVERLETAGQRRALFQAVQDARADWLTGLLGRHDGAGARALSAVRFVPGGDCLYRGEDPLERMVTLPGLLALELAAREPWGPLDTFDPFRCNLVLTALSAAPAADLRAHLADHGGDCELIAVAAGTEDSGLMLPPEVKAVLEAQQALLAEGSPQSFAGRAASAGLAAANALRFCRRSELSGRITRAAEQSLLSLSPHPLQHALGELLSLHPASSTPARADPLHSPPVAAHTFRIDAEQVDALVRLAGELTVVTHAIGPVVKLARAGDPSVPDLLKDRHAALERLTAELQRTAVRMRVRPLSTVLRRFPRLAREIATNLGKSVKVVIEGDETEADKAIVEMVFEPLLHLVRNAIDHGVEREQERTAAGKAATATLRIRAERRADQVIIEVSDDGAGIDVARLREVAVARGLVSNEQLLTMTEAEALALIFSPGFSTTTHATQLSGRGVGMDAVRRAVERIGGRVSVASARGRGTDVKLSLPFSVMMTHIMTVEAGGQVFGLPLDAIIETIRVPRAAIAKVGTAPVVVLRNRTLPLIDLATLLGAESRKEKEDEDGATLVVAAAGGDWGAFRVDRIMERLHLIMKPLEGLLAGTPGIVGTTLLGDGRVLLVLNVAEML